MKYYTTSIEIDQPVEIVFSAISKRLGSWWGKQDTPIDSAGIEFKVSWLVPWYRFKVIKFVEDLEMTWKCIDANQIIDGLGNIQKGWVGSKIHWRLTSINPKTTLLEFEHEGLLEEFTCFQFCADTWDHFITESLISYLDRCCKMDSFI